VLIGTGLRVCVMEQDGEFSAAHNYFVRSNLVFLKAKSGFYFGLRRVHNSMSIADENRTISGKEKRQPGVAGQPLGDFSSAQ